MTFALAQAQFSRTFCRQFVTLQSVIHSIVAIAIFTLPAALPLQLFTVGLLVWHLRWQLQRERARCTAEQLEFRGGSWWWRSAVADEVEVAIRLQWISRWLLVVAIEDGNRHTTRVFYADGMTAEAYWQLKRLLQQREPRC